MADPYALLAEASRMMREDDYHHPYWACWLARQALESVVDGLVVKATTEGTDVTDATMRSKLTILSWALEGTPVAHRARVAWDQLSHVCHLPAYELAPTAAEVRSWLGDVNELAVEYRRVCIPD